MSFVITPLIWMIGGGIGIIIAADIGLTTFPSLVLGFVGAAIFDFICFGIIGVSRSIGRTVKGGPKWVNEDTKVGIYDMGNGEWKAVHYPSQMEAIGETPTESDDRINRKIRKHGWDKDVKTNGESK